VQKFIAKKQPISQVDDQFNYQNQEQVDLQEEQDIQNVDHQLDEENFDQQ
jgi:hypothetical protein